MLGIYKERSVKKVKLDAIRIDGGTQCRVVIDQPTVYSYLEAMKEGAEFPKIETVFDGTTYWLTDGFHRYHAFKLLNLKEVEVSYEQGTLKDAQIKALKANSKHGKPLTNEDKRNKVEMALKIEGFADLSNAELARICEVSRSFVGSIRNPEIKKKQQENNEKRILKKAKELKTKENSCSGTTKSEPDPYAGSVPDEDEIRASELAIQADQEAMYKLLESDDALATAHQEIKRLNHLNSQLEIQVRGLMNQSNEQIKMIKQLQKENDKLKGKK
jgi:hypothetical protein